MSETLRVMLADLESAAEIYRPTRFWQDCSKEIIADIAKEGLECFKRHPSALNYYVSSYALSYNYNKDVMEYFIRMHFQTLQNFLKPCNVYDFERIFESDVGQPPEPLNINSRRTSHSMLRYGRGLALLSMYADEPLYRFLEIGGGFGCLGEILLKSHPLNRYINVDIPPTAAVSSYYLSTVFSDRVTPYEETRGWDEIQGDDLIGKKRAAVLCSWQLPKLRGKIDVFTNFVSFQEMEINVVSNYVSLVAALEPKYILLRNAREGKRADGAPADVIRTNDKVSSDTIYAFFAEKGYRILTRESDPFGDTFNGILISEVCVLKRT